jgi:hypothetical protein
MKDGIVRMVDGLPPEPPALADSQKKSRAEQRGGRRAGTKKPSLFNSFLGLRLRICGLNRKSYPAERSLTPRMD